MMKKYLSMLLIMVMLITMQPVECYASAETLDTRIAENGIGQDEQGNSVTLTSTEDDIYEIMRGSRNVALNYVNPQRTYFNFPTSGRLVLSDDDRAKWTLDESGEFNAKSASQLSGRQVSAGQHYLELIDNWGPGYETATINYIFYPNCTVYYLHGKNFKKLFSYELSENHIKKEIPAITEKGYSFDGWYTDQDLEQAITEVDTATGNDWYLYPKCTPIDYTITYELDGGINAATNPATYTIEDQSVILMPAEKKGYSFVRWYILSGGKKEDITEIDTAQCKNVSVYAEWHENKYQITYMDAYTHHNPSTYSITDETVQLEDAVRAGYEFQGWYTDADYTEPIDTIDCEKVADITLYAKWEPITYSVRYELNGGMNAQENGTEYTVENIQNIGTPTKDDYDFAGWYLDETFEVPITEIASVNGQAVTLYAKWVRQSFTITYIDGGIHKNPFCYTGEDETILLTDGMREGYGFVGWYLDQEHTQKIDVINTDSKEDITIYGAWTLNTYMVSYDLDGGVNASGNITEFTVEDGDFVLLEPTKTGCTFSGWYTLSDSSGTSMVQVDKIKTDICQDLTLYAKWEENDIIYNIKHDAWTVDGVIDDWEFSFPVDGMIYFSHSGGTDSPWFSLDDMDAWQSVSSASALNGSISAGSHCLTITGFGVTTSYTFYPRCRVYYIYENSSELLTSYYMESSSSKLDLKMPDIKGYRTIGLYRDRDMTIPIASVDKSVGKDWYVYPEVEPIVYTVTYDLDGGTNSEENITAYTIEDEDFVLQEPTKEGYVFEGWYDTPELRTKVTSITADDCKNLILYAKWSKKTGSDAEDENTYQIITDTKLMQFYNSYKYTSWYIDFPGAGKVKWECDYDKQLYWAVDYDKDTDRWYENGVRTSGLFTTITSKETHCIEILNSSRYDESTGSFNAQLSYTFYPQCNVYYVYDNEPRLLNSYYLETSSSKLNLEMPNIKGYRTTGLYSDRDMTAPIASVDKSVGKDWYVYPKVEPIVYTVTYDLDGGTNSGGNITTYTIEDRDFVLQAPIKEGYVFEGWYATPALKTQVTKISTSDCKNLTLYAKWSKVEESEPKDDGAVPELTKPQLEQSKVTMTVGEGQSLLVENAKGNITWKVKNPKILKITKKADSGMKFIALNSGKTEITAQVDGVTLKCIVTVKKPSLKYKKITIRVGKSKKNEIKKGIKLDSATKVKWKSGNKKIATVTKGKIKGKKPGKVTMTVTINNYKIKFIVTVKK